MINVWKIAPGEHANDWNVFRERGCIGLGWLELGNFGKFRNEDEVLAALKRQYGKDEPGTGRGAATMIWRFVHEVKRSHIVVANDRYNGVAGIGIIESDYLPPKSKSNPMRGDKSTHRHHVRKVKWLIKKPIELEGNRFFVQSTLWPLKAVQVVLIAQAYLNAYPKDLQIKQALEKMFGSIQADAALDSTMNEQLAETEQELAEEEAFDPTGIKDARKKVLSSIVKRRGQPVFRKRLLKAYKNRCAITGCSVESVLEAAHITPYKGEKTNHAGNGLLLRADLHTLFDLQLVTADAKTMRLLVSPKLAGSGYDDFHGKRISVPKDPSNQPSRKALQKLQRKSGLK